MEEMEGDPPAEGVNSLEVLSSQEVVAEEVVAEEIVAEEVVAEEIVAEEVVAEEVVAEEVVAEEVVAEQVVAEQVVAEQVVAEGVVAEEDVLGVEAGVKKDRYLKDLVDGVNYRIIPGKLMHSKIVVKGKYGYLVDRKKVENDSKPKFYVKCKFPRCNARGFIKDKFLTLPTGKFNQPHTCDLDGAGPSEAYWSAQAALARMKERAANETTSFEVSINKC